MVTHSTTQKKSSIVNIFTLNTKNIKSNKLYIEELLEKNKGSVMFLQETWLTTAEKIKNVLDVDATEYLIKEKSHERPDRGRPYGGVAWIVSKFISKRIVIVFHNHRISHCAFDQTVIIGVYMHHNDNSDDTATENEENIGILDSLMEQFEKAKIMIVGDWNMDIYRRKKHDRLLSNFAKKNELTNVSKLFGQQIDFTYEQNNNRSMIDHVLVNRQMAKEVEQCNIVQDNMNTSDHLIVNTTIKYSGSGDVVETKREMKKRIDWNDEQKRFEYGIETWRQLRKIQLPHLKADDTEQELKYTAERTIKEMNKALMSAHEMGAKTEERNVERGVIKRNRWWNGEIEEVLRQKKYWQDRSEEKYKFYKTEFRRLQRRSVVESEESKFRKYNDLFYMDRRRFWQKLKTENKIDEKVEIEISVLEEQYTELFNVEAETKESSEKWANIGTLMEYEAHKIEEKNIICQVEESIVEQIIRKLQNNKAVGISGISNEMVKFSGYGKVVSIITYLLNIVIGRQVMPDDFNVGKIIPILKDVNASASDKKNIRPITISDVISNVYEKVVQARILASYKPNELQFGFKENSSCQHALFTMKELIRCSAARGETTYVCALDASKAFDKVSRKILMAKLKGQVDEATWLSFKKYYCTAQAMVSNEGEQSGRFPTSVGVKQGGPSSPLLFSIYSEELIKRIKRMGCGVRIGKLVIGIICFADDVLLICNRLSEMQSMLKECEKYGLETMIKWNPTKTVFCRFGRAKKEKCQLMFCDEELVEQDEFKYLGVIMKNDFKCKRHILNRISTASYSAHRLTACGVKSKELDVFVKVFLYKTFCRPVLYYGITTSYIGKTEQKIIQKCEARMLKRLQE